MNFKIITSLFLNIAFVACVFAQMEVKVYHKIPGTDSPNDNQVMPHIKIENSGSDTFTLSDITIEYYMYETDLSVSDLTWRYDWCNLGNIFNVQFFNLDEPYIEGDKKANMKFLISFTSNNKLTQGQYVLLNIGIYKNDWSHNFSETAHWSYAQNTSYTLSDSIVVRDVSGNGGVIISGTPPPTEQRQMVPYPENCGPGDSTQVDGTISLNPAGADEDTVTLSNRYHPRMDANLLAVNASGGMTITTRTGTWIIDDRGIRTSCDSLTIFTDMVHLNSINADSAITVPYIKTSELRVTQNIFPDYVFSSTYSLKSIPEIDQYIRKYKRLPGFPTEEEVKKHGMNVGAVQVKLVEKIEEMTLLMIQMDNRIKELEDQLKNK